MKKTIFILSDALKSEYINQYNLSFLKEMIKDEKTLYIKKIFPSTGFCEIIEYVTGKKAEETGYLTQIAAKQDWKVTNSTIITLIEIVETFILKIPKIRTWYSKFFQKKVDWFLKNYFAEEMIRVRYKIPLSLLSCFEPTESIDEYDSCAFGQEDNIFYKFKESNISYDLDDFVKFNKIKGTDESRISNLKEKIINKKLEDFTLLYIGYGEIAHNTSTNSIYFGKKLTSFDKELRIIFELIKKNYDNFELSILGDHGMIDIGEYINVVPMIKNIAKNLGLIFKKDYIYFIDSTLLRLFLKDKNLVLKIKEMLEKELFPNYEFNMADYINKFDNKYGDIIILLRPGKVFYPDFFNYNKKRGMHGYYSKAVGQAGTYISISSNKKTINFVEELNLSEIKKYILYGYDIK
ncbi:MAG: alkaline phosphatase family protein [Fusobacteriaceae bacterium]|nr:alkaline phosphatase family protein [Fusobacteriaceae bacterium]